MIQLIVTRVLFIMSANLTNKIITPATHHVFFRIINIFHVEYCNLITFQKLHYCIIRFYTWIHDVSIENTWPSHLVCCNDKMLCYHKRDSLHRIGVCSLAYTLVALVFCCCNNTEIEYKHWIRILKSSNYKPVLFIE